MYIYIGIYAQISSPAADDSRRRNKNTVKICFISHGIKSTTVVNQYFLQKSKHFVNKSVVQSPTIP